MKNKTAGITLIALVVTIIVLLILAGISIQMLTGDNGILTRAGEAQKSTDKFGALEIIQLCTLASYDKTGMINEEDLENELNKEGATIKSKKSNKWYVEYKGYDFEIDLSKRTVVLKEEGNPPEASIEELLRQYFSTDGWAVADPIYNSWRFAEVESVPEIDPNKLEFIWYETIWNDDHSTGHIDDFNELNTARIVMYENKWYLIQNLNEEISVKELNINLNPKEYIITTINTVTGEELSNKITVLSRFSENTDVVKYYKNATHYTVKIIGDDGKAAGAGEDVTFNINGIFYTRQTDENGIAKLSINLPPGNYVITAEYKGCKVSNDIKVLPVLYATDIKMKYHDGTHFVSTLVDGHGRPFANQFVTFNINGVFYSKITDNSGQAKLKINLLAGKYIITSSYNGSNIANTITITA